MAAGKEEGEPGGWLGDLRASRLFLGVQLLLAKHPCEAAACHACAKRRARAAAVGKQVEQEKQVMPVHCS
jgi:hypothetical protein